MPTDYSLYVPKHSCMVLHKQGACSRNTWSSERSLAVHSCKQQPCLFACPTNLPAMFRAVSTWYSSKRCQLQLVGTSCQYVLLSQPKNTKHYAEFSLRQQNCGLLSCWFPIPNNIFPTHQQRVLAIAPSVCPSFSRLSPPALTHVHVCIMSLAGTP